MLGFGFGFGLFLNPSDPNRYVRDWAREAPAGVNPLGGTEFFVNYLPLVSIDVGLLPWLRLQAAGEFAFSTLNVTLANENAEIVEERTFGFARLSAVFTANLEYPINDARTTNIFVGAGPGVHYIKFEQLDATAPGFRAQLGIGLLQEKVRADGAISFDYARGVAQREHEWFNGQVGSFVVDYTSLIASAIIHFNIVP